jgi:DNA end-binding protein Ku
MLDDDDFEQARIESSTTLTISKFVDVGSIDPIFFDTAYYVAPDGAAGRDVFVVLREAIRKSRTAALSRIVVARRERAVAIIPSGTGLVCHTLHEQDDLWNAAPLFEDLDDVKPETDMVALATQLIERQNGKFQPDDTADRYEAKLREVIDAKLKGEGITPEQPSQPDRGNVIDLMAALKASLGQQNAQAPKKRAARKRAS